MTMIVTLQQAADHLRIDDTTDEANDLNLKIMAASAVVLDYIEWSHDRYAAAVEIAELDSDYEIDSDWDEDWDSDWLGDEDHLYTLKAATLLLVGYLHADRAPGRDTISAGYTEGNLPSAIRMLLYPLKTFGVVLEDD